MKSLVFAGVVIALSSITSATNFVIDGTTRLNTITIPNTGVHHIRFAGAGYENPGSLSLSNNNCDTLYFERNSGTDSAVVVSSNLAYFVKQGGVVVFRNLVFKLGLNAVLFDTSSINNHHLTFDSCLVSGQSQNAYKAFYWGGDGSSSITVSNSMFSNTGSLSLSGSSSITVSNSMFSNTGSLTLTGVSPSPSDISLTNNLFNFSGVLTASVSRKLEMKYNTINRAQFQLNGNFTATYSIQNNYFANPPVVNNLPADGIQKFPVLVSTRFLSSGNEANNNIRYSTWNSFDSPSSAAPIFTDPTNTTVVGTKDSTITWDWKIPGNNTHGAWNGITPLPNFTLYPPDSTLSLAVPGGNANFTFAPTQFPSVAAVSFGTIPYASSLPDTLRSWFVKDTTLVITGQATVKSIVMPLRNEGNFLLLTPSPKVFIPAFGGQNTYRRNNASVIGIGPDTSLLFSSITRAGRTTFRTSSLTPSSKRLRILKKASNPNNLAFNTNAEGLGPIKFGLSKTGVDLAYISDSTTFWIGASNYVKAIDSSGKWWGSISFSSTLDAILLEKLALGSGRDTVNLISGHRVISLSASGHQLQTDSSQVVDQALFPNLGNFSRSLAFNWPGRIEADSFYAEFKKTNPRQTLFVKQELQAIAVTALMEDTTKILAHLHLSDTSKVFFLARKYPISAGNNLSFSLIPDSVSGLSTSTPGSLNLDSGYTISGLSKDTLRILAKRSITLDNLTLTQGYTAFIAGEAPARASRLAAYVRQGNTWVMDAATRQGNRYKLDLSKEATALVIAERIFPNDTASIHPMVVAVATVVGNNLVVTPKLDSTEKVRTFEVLLQTRFVNANGFVVLRSDTAGSDSALSVLIPAGVLGAYRVGYRNFAGVISWDSVWTKAPLDATEFTASVNDLAPMFRAQVWELVGFPQDMSTSMLMSVPGTMLKTRNSGWAPFTTTTLIQGQGYLVGTTQPFKPALQSTSSFKLSDTMNLSAGWNYIASPVAFAIADQSIGLDSTVVSYFQTLDWQGNGKSAQPKWVQADILKPFLGYAVFAKSASQLVFNLDRIPNAFTNATAKVSARNYGLTISNVEGLLTKLHLSASPRGRLILGLPDPAPDFRAAWGNKDGSIYAAPDSQLSISIHVSQNSPLLITFDLPPSKQGLWVCWNPTTGKLIRVGKTLEVSASSGWNSYRLLDISEASFLATESKLRGSIKAFSITRAVFSRSEVEFDFHIPESFGKAERVNISAYQASGRALFRKELGPMAIGSHSKSLPTPTTIGWVWLKLDLVSGARQQSLIQRVWASARN